MYDIISTLLTVVPEAVTTAAEETTAIEEETTTFVQDPVETVEKASKFITEFKNYLPSIINFGLNLLIALVIFVVGRFIIKNILKITKRFLARTSADVTVSKFLVSLVRVVLYAVLIMIMLETVGIKTTSFLALFTTAGLAAGLALQGSLSNFAGGVLILILKPFKVGDYISTNGLEGTVEKIDLFYTTLITVDNKLNIIPNGTLSNSTMVNFSKFNIRRVDFEVGICYDSDMKKARDVIEACGLNSEFLYKDKPVRTFVKSLDASQVTIGMWIWTETAHYWDMKFELTEKIKSSLDEAGIEIPFNQIVVHTEK